MKRKLYIILLLLGFFISINNASALTCNSSVSDTDVNNNTTVVNIKIEINPSALSGINLDQYDFNDVRADIPIEVYDALDEAVQIYCNNCTGPVDDADANGYHLVYGSYFSVAVTEAVVNFAQYTASENFQLQDQYAFKSRFFEHSNNGTTCPDIKFSDHLGQKYVYFTDDATGTDDDFISGDEGGSEPGVNQPADDMLIEGFSLCENSRVLKVFQVIGYIIFIAKIVIPLLLIIFGSIDFAKAIISSDDKMIKDAGMSLAKRFVAAIIVFFIPTILNLLLSLVYNIDDVRTQFLDCTTCLLEPSSCDTEE